MAIGAWNILEWWHFWGGKVAECWWTEFSPVSYWFCLVKHYLGPLGVGMCVELWRLGVIWYLFFPALDFSRVSGPDPQMGHGCFSRLQTPWINRAGEMSLCHYAYLKLHGKLCFHILPIWSIQVLKDVVNFGCLQYPGSPGRFQSCLIKSWQKMQPASELRKGICFHIYSLYIWVTFMCIYCNMS